MRTTEQRPVDWTVDIPDDLRENGSLEEIAWFWKSNGVNPTFGIEGEYAEAWLRGTSSVTQQRPSCFDPVED